MKNVKRMWFNNPRPRDKEVKRYLSSEIAGWEKPLKMATEVLIQTEDVVDFVTVNTFRQDGLFCDTEIRTSDGERLAAHACIVAAGSPVLRRLLLKQAKQIKSRRALVVRGKDVYVCGAIWRVVLQLMYTGRAFVTIARLADLLQAAETLQIDRLRTVCAALLEDIDPDVDAVELPELLNVTNGHGDNESETKCWTSVDVTANQRYSDESIFAGQYGMAAVKLEPTTEDYDNVGDSFHVPAPHSNGDGFWNVAGIGEDCAVDPRFAHIKTEPMDADEKKPLFVGHALISPTAENGHIARRKGLHPQRRTSVASTVVQKTLAPLRKRWCRRDVDELSRVGQRASKRHHLRRVWACLPARLKPGSSPTT
ncbi:hypothetical protein LSAT2_007699 [Lamellibrachia satsuma]|nr:hypothetical protein LSAT2_007699 [Lamellibrachia satsuma]